MSITFAAQLNKMITAGLGGAVDAPETNVAVGFRYTEKTASGNPISFSDGAGGKPVKALEIGFSPIQDLNGYDHPWPAGGGNNVYAGSTASGTTKLVEWEFDSDGGLTLVGTADSAGGRNVINSGNFSLPAGRYYLQVFTGSDSAGTPAVFLQDGSTIIGYPNGSAVVLESDSTTINIGINVVANDVYNYSAKIAIFKVNSTAYSPYSNICPITGWSQLELNHADDTEEIQLGATYYGGAVDVVSGEGSVTYGYYAVNSNTILTKQGTYDDFTRWTLSESGIGTIAGKPAGAIICNAFKPGALVLNGVFMHGTTGQVNVTPQTDIGSTAEEVLAWLIANGVYFVYELANPITLTLTPLDIVTQEGGNIFITDANGSMTITYTAVGYTEGY